jgi:hypothetical protein
MFSSICKLKGLDLHNEALKRNKTKVFVLLKFQLFKKKERERQVIPNSFFDYLTVDQTRKNYLLD